MKKAYLLNIWIGLLVVRIGSIDLIGVSLGFSGWSWSLLMLHIFKIMFYLLVEEVLLVLVLYLLLVEGDSKILNLYLFM